MRLYKFVVITKIPLCPPLRKGDNKAGINKNDLVSLCKREIERDFELAVTPAF
jgi:hypothetical protein